MSVLVLLYLCALFADFVAPYHYETQSIPHSYAPPSIHFFDAEGSFHLRPFIYMRKSSYDEYQRRIYKEDTRYRCPLRLFVRGDDHKVLWIFKTDLHLFGVGDPVPASAEVEAAGEAPEKRARLYLLGADARGRDIFSRLLYGARISLSIGLVGSAITFVLGMIIGGISGYFGGILDNVLQRVCEMFMMIPGFYLMLALRAALPVEMPSTHVYLLIVAILSFIGWAGFARVIRGMVLTIKSKDFVVAARAAGARNITIITRHVLPNTLSYGIISITLGIPGYILGESALSLLGLGIQDPQASWGNMLREAMAISEISLHPWILVPGLMIFLAVICFNFVGDGLRDAFDPQGLTGRAAR